MRKRTRIETIPELVQSQRDFFKAGKTLNLELRIQALLGLKDIVRKRKDDIHNALYQDLGKNEVERSMTEISVVLSEITYMVKHLRTFAKKRHAPTPLTQFAAKSYMQPSPYGVVLVMSPWNYPFQLALVPAIEAIAAGNTVVIKPSAYSPATSRILAELVREAFDPEYLAIILGGRTENAALLDADFDYVFFTGSTRVAREVMKRTAERLIPVTLELGGKSPCIVDATADISLAARRIVFGKFLNCGQTCVAPDYIYCDERVKPRLLTALKNEIIRQYGAFPLANADYGKIISETHFTRLKTHLEKAEKQIAVGGGFNDVARQIEPTILDGVSWDDPIMSEEIFGPILPILTYSEQSEIVPKMKTLPHPLAFYVFSSDRVFADRVLTECQFGGGCINDVVIHLAGHNLPFGGVGESGMGAYHGKYGFDRFSHIKSIVDKKTWMDLSVRYQPYTGMRKKLLKWFLG